MLRSDLINLCRKNNRLAQQELYNSYKAKLMGVCRRYARGREDAQDMLQESFFKILTKIDKLEDAEKIEGWMMRITINTAINYYHSMFKDKFQVDLSENELAFAQEETILADLSNEAILKMISDLPDGARVVFNLYAIEGYSHAEISKMVGINEGTSRSQLHYAKRILKSKLTKTKEVHVKSA